MGWAVLGVHELTRNWESVGGSLVGSQILRITQDWGAVTFPHRGYLLLGMKFASGETHVVKRLYNQTLPRIVLMDIDDALQANGLTTWKLQIRTNTNAFINPAYSWEAYIQVTDIVLPPGEAINTRSIDELAGLPGSITTYRYLSEGTEDERIEARTVTGLTNRLEQRYFYDSSFNLINTTIIQL